MQATVDLLSPKQVARAIGVSESSLKRWCDQGLIKTVRTAGGHRKMPTADVLRFVREHNHPLVSPQVLGLPPASEFAELGLARGTSRLASALLSGDELLARQIVFDLFLARHPLATIFDKVIAAAFREIGDRWACHDADVYQERRGVEITCRVLFELRKLQPMPENNWPATGGTIEGDLYALPCIMAELVLRGVGFRATPLGCSVPFASLVRAVQETKPKLFWLSVSHLPAGVDFAAEFALLSRACRDSETALVVGGRALSADLRQQMSYSAYCDTMQHLETFATTMARTLRKAKKRSTNASRPSERVAAAKRSRRRHNQRR